MEHLGRDNRLSLETDDWVEIEDDDYVLTGQSKTLLQVGVIDSLNMQVRLNKAPDDGVGRDAAKHPLLRRWHHTSADSKRGELDQETGTLLVKEDTWIELEDGVQVYFSSTVPYTVKNGETLEVIAEKFSSKPEELRQLNNLAERSDVSSGQTLEVPAHPKYRSGDYWLIPARTTTGDVEWPGGVGQPEARPPHGINHHYAPLAVVVSAGANERDIPSDCRCSFTLNRTCPPPAP